MSMERAHGLEGSQVISDTAQVTPATNYIGWVAIQVITDTVLNTTGTTSSNITNLAGYNGVTLVAGTILYGRFTAIQLASGIVQAFKLKNPVES
jgi:hypothetical protein